MISAAYFIVSGIEPNQGCVIARGRQGIFSIKKMNSTSELIKEATLVQGNVDKTQKRGLNVMELVHIYIFKYRKLRNITENLYNAFQIYPIISKITIHTTIMSARIGQFLNYIPSCK
ncbi:hypothetical protein GJ496_001273 [Pomphorhynchus laevis]|nr:hypothetical protein GJ496_001273 [Pomphorhynchus laevis]